VKAATAVQAPCVGSVAEKAERRYKQVHPSA
jgi:hypothetical protein